jgi:hypothetical protein
VVGHRASMGRMKEGGQPARATLGLVPGCGVRAGESAPGWVAGTAPPTVRAVRAGHRHRLHLRENGALKPRFDPLVALPQSSRAGRRSLRGRLDGVGSTRAGQAGRRIHSLAEVNHERQIRPVGNPLCEGRGVPNHRTSVSITAICSSAFGQESDSWVCEPERPGSTLVYAFGPCETLGV